MTPDLVDIDKYEIKVKNLWSFHIVISPKTAKKCTKNYNPCIIAIVLLINPCQAMIPCCCILLNCLSGGPRVSPVLVLYNDFCI